MYLNKHNFNLLYKNLVRPHLAYGNVVWSPFLKSDITLIENVQRRATRYVPDINKLKYQERLEVLSLPTLQYRRFRADMTEMKSTNTRGRQCAMKIRHSNTTIRRNFFAFRVASVWNSLSSDIVGSVSLNAFKKETRLSLSNKEHSF